MARKFYDSLRGYAFEVLKRDNFTCRYCGLNGTNSFDNWLALSWDHLLPKGYKERNNLDYIVAACNFCNTVDNQYFNKAKKQGINFENLTPDELVEQRKLVVDRTRDSYNAFWNEHVKCKIIKEKISFEYCALQYLNIYFDNDKKCHDTLVNGKKDDKLNALKEAGTFYSVARNLPRKYDIDNKKKKYKRYEPVLDILDSINKNQISSESSVDIVKKIQHEISKRYGGRGVLSLTTKFLWLKIKHPSILIYDSRVRAALEAALEIEVKDYEKYYKVWKVEYKKYEGKIKKVCLNLHNQHLYLKNQYDGLQDEIKEISSESWFHERVFDTYLWHQG